MSRSCSTRKSLQQCIALLCIAVAGSSCHESEEHHAETYLNEWAVEIHGGEKRARAVAEETGFVYMSRVGSLDHFHVFAHPNHPDRHHEHAADKTASLRGHGKVRWAEQQKILKRFKRAIVPVTAPESVTRQLSQVPVSPNAAQHGEPYPLPRDPWWEDMWYHHLRIQDPRPVWQRGFTGRGVVVSIVDDGIDYTHPDLRLPYDANGSYDFVDNDTDPMPTNRHGTLCAGVVAATMNDNCIVGAAYNSSIGGIRLLDGQVTDRLESSALSFNPQHIHIYSNSWGPSDTGYIVDGPAELTQAALKNGAEKGRGGLGSIFVFASGNGGGQGDSCGCDGYTNTIYTISIGSMSQRGRSPWYSEHCANIMAVTYSSGNGHEKKVITTNFPNGTCTSRFTATSASTAMAAGLLALVLEANPKLTWRDVQHIIVLTATERTYQPIYRTKWYNNGAGHRFSHDFGFGLMHTAGMTNLARHWDTVPEMRTCLENVSIIETHNFGSFTLEATGCVGTANEVRYAENVVAIVSAVCSRRGALKFDLTSPMSTKSNLLPFRRHDLLAGTFDSWRFLTVFNWGENPRGTWKFDVDINTRVSILVQSIQLEIHGTFDPPKIRKLPEFEACHPQCYDGCIGLGSTDCHSCRELTVFKTDGSFDCIGGEECPLGSVRREKTCRPCRVQGCLRCNQTPETCEVCSPGLTIQRNKCSMCPAGARYSSSARACVRCSPQCSECANVTACASCSSGLLWQGQCVSQCPANISFQDGSDLCVPCHADCVGCTSANHCKKCQSPMLLYAGKCYQTCPTGLYQKDGRCRRCYAGCATCSRADFCHSCAPGLHLHSNGLCSANAISHFQLLVTQVSGK